MNEILYLQKLLKYLKGNVDKTRILSAKLQNKWNQN